MNKRKVMLFDEKEVCTSITNSLFSNDEYFEIIATVNNENEMLEKLNCTNPDLIIIEPKLLNDHLNSFISSLSQKTRAKILLFPFKEQNNQINGSSFSVINKPATLKMLSKNFGAGKQILETIYSLFDIKNKIKVMIVDDSNMMRVVISNLLHTDKNIEICGFAPNGKDALQQLSQINPDVILLDIEMPIMDGLEFLRHARLKSNAKIIILSSVAATGSEKAKEALRLGAAAIITKPSGAVSLDLSDKSGGLVIDTIHKVVM